MFRVCTNNHYFSVAANYATLRTHFFTDERTFIRLLKIYFCIECVLLGERPGSNRRVKESQSFALPLGYARQTLSLYNIKEQL